MSSGNRPTARSFATKAGLLAICGLLTGVVVSAASFPAAALSGLAAKEGAQKFAALPSTITQQSAPQVTRVYASDGRTLIATMYDEFRSDVPITQISPNMQNAIVAAEDHTFYTHNGVDPKGIARAFVNNQNGGAQQGASTLTMQYVRMAQAYGAKTPQEAIDATKDTPERKVAEMKNALQVEKDLSKKQILERYLNLAPFGNGAYGIYAGSQVYFKKSPKDLSIAESALLAGMVKAPTAFDPTTKDGYPQALDRRNYILDNMLSLGQITKAQADEAKKVKLVRTTNRPGNGCTSVKKNSWGFFCDYFFRWWMGRKEFGANAYERERQLRSGGYTIVTSLDVKAQDSARKEITSKIKDDNVNAVLIAGVEPKSGRVKSLAANRKFKLDDGENPKSSNPQARKAGARATYPNTTNPIITGDGDIDGYQAGSVFKMFTMVAALEDGLGLDHEITSGSTYHSKYPVAFNSPAACPGTSDYCPSNASKSEQGTFNMWTGFGASVNTYFVPLQEQVGAEKVVDVSKRFGLQFRSSGDRDLIKTPEAAHDFGAFTLGVTASTPLEIANAYATLAADGMYCSPTPIKQIYAADKSKVAAGQPSCTRATDVDVARRALDAARCPVGDRAQLGTCKGATERNAYQVIKHPIFGKTGTTDADKTASLVVGSQQLVVAGYMVNPDWANHRDRMRHDIINPVVYKTLADYLKDTDSVEFKKPGE
ncbi:transglycosylase domain-containing protein [Actinoplanes sp. NBRC 103695]|uniref:transglycosylase domain-containing protein n=1 Tax=Actinoplanes sp. NBRC 103695 TaxID=3032202 RepID=UPI0024A4A1C6|nr:transglycosylase domain-containing protein [Actinoplanes sp. NBRC 103695]GLY99505.1 penicillin-binding protein [Actinoplanes sp. NBRC 103695]